MSGTKAKDYLMQVKKLDALINNNIGELEVLQALAEKTTAVLGGERVQTSGSGDSVADTTIKIVMLKQEINEEIDRFVDLRNEARKLINEACDYECARLLTMRYLGIFNDATDKVEFKKWEEIAIELDFTYQHVSDRLHKKALSQIQKALDEVSVTAVFA